MGWKVGDLLIFKDEGAARGDLLDDVYRVEALVMSKDLDTYRGERGHIYGFKAFNHGRFTMFESSKLRGNLVFDRSWLLDKEHSDGKQRCCNLCCDLLIDADHLHRQSGNRFWKCKNPNCTVGVWQRANGVFNSLPADAPTRTARSELFQAFDECKGTMHGMRRAKALLDREGALHIGNLNRYECQEYTALLAAPQNLQPSIDQALDILAGKKPREQSPTSYPIMTDGVRKLDLD